MFLVPYYILHIIILAAGIVFAWIKVSKLRNTSATYNPRLLPFAYFSLSSWILGALQYVILAASPFISFPSDFFLDTGRWLDVTQIALWACAILSLHSKQVPRNLCNLTFPKIFPIVIAFALLTHRTEVLTSDLFGHIEGVLGAAIFTVVAISMWKWRLNKFYAAAFLIHGYSQWIWRFLWSIPSPETHFAAALAFPLWRMALFAAWIALVSAMLKLRITISSTGDDLANERKVVNNTLSGLHFEKFRATTSESLPHLPRRTRTLFAEQCDIFILIIGEQYGPLIETEGISIVEVEYKVAHAQNPEKILLYVKDGVNREPRLEEFIQRVKDSERGHVMSSFTTPEDLHGKIQHDLSRWLTFEVKPKTHSKEKFIRV
jgi:uncharacterized protein DUF4062